MYISSEAVTVILQYSPSVSSVLSRKKITKELIFKYLHKKKIPCIDPMMTKTAMVQTMTRYWEKTAQRQLNEDKDSKRESAAKRPAPAPTNQPNEEKHSSSKASAAKRPSLSPTKQLNEDAKRPTPAPDSPVRRVVIIPNNTSKPSKPLSVSKATQSDLQVAVVKVCIKISIKLYFCNSQPINTIII
jgi:flagellar biosynthesis GTPase FlhF